MIPWFSAEFYLGSLHVNGFGLLVAIGIVFGQWVMRRRGAALGLDDDKVWTMIASVVVAGIVVGHLYDVFAYQTHTPLSWSLILNPTLGLSSFGGYMGATIGCLAWCRLNHQPVLPYADSCAYGFPFGWTLARLGCFAVHDHPGALTTFFLGVQYPNGTRHDLGLYEAIWSFLISIVFFVLARTNPKRPVGTYLAVLLLSYGPTRFLLDFLRAADVAGADPRYAGLTGAQYLSLLLFAIGVLVARSTIAGARSRSMGRGSASD